jgi:hypothetical protein
MIGRPRGGAIARATALAALATGAVGCDEVVRIELAIVPNAGNCGLVEDGNLVDLAAYTELGLNEPAVINIEDGPASLSFPPETRQLALAVRGTGGAALSHGKTPPFTIEDRPPRVPVSLFPVGGTCPVGSLGVARRYPVVGAAGDGALVLGGVVRDGATFDAVKVLEYFDPFTSSFTPIELPNFAGDPRGAAIAPFPDGRALILGGLGSFYSIFDPEISLEEGTLRGIVFETRAFPAAVAVDDRSFVLAGGCVDVDSAANRCGGQFLSSVELVGLTPDGDPTTPVQLADLVEPRAGAIATIERFGDGTTAVVIAGGYVDGDGTPATTVERIPIAAGAASTITTGATGALAVALESGSVLTAFSIADEPPATASTVAIPGRDVATALPAIAFPRRDTVMVALEDGTVVAIGGVDGPDPDDSPGRLLQYLPTEGWRPLGEVPPTALVGHGAARLADGSVLVAGGYDPATDAEVTTVTRFRPSLVGPLTPSVLIFPPDPVEDLQLVPLDPTAVDHEDDGLQLLGAGGDTHALVGGPMIRDGTLTVVYFAGDAGSPSLVARATSSGDFVRVVIPRAQPAVVERWVAGTPTTLCTAASVVGPPGQARLTIAEDTLTLELVLGAPPLVCALPEGSAAAGRWGVGVTAGGRVDLTSVELSR